MKYIAKLRLAMILFMALFFSCQPSTSPIEYPISKKDDISDEYFGTVVSDDYRWLEDDRSNETLDWVKNQNSVTFGYLNNIPFRKKVEERIESLLDYERTTSPEVHGGYSYYYRNDGLQNHAVLYRKKETTEEEIYIDPNTFNKEGTIGLGTVEFSNDGSLSAHLISEGGSDWSKVIVMNTDTKEQVGDTLVDVKFSGISWRGNEGFYYSSYDRPKEGSVLSAKTQYHKVYFHELKNPQNMDELIFGGESQPNRYVGADVNDNGNYLIIGAAQNTSGNKVHLINLESNNKSLTTIQDDYMVETNYITSANQYLYFLTNLNAPNYRLVKVDVNKPETDNWIDVIPEGENVLRVTTAGNKLFANYLVDANTQVKQYDLDGKLEFDVALPGIGTAAGFTGKKNDQITYYSFSSFTYPSTIYKYSMADGSSELYAAPNVEFDPSKYKTSQKFYESKDGTKVPMFIVHKKDVELDGKNPTLLYAYGGFNVSLTPRFVSSLIVWLENGGIYAQPNLRGGGEYGEEWHEAGTKLKKQNVFDDFIAAAEYLVNQKYTSSEYLAIRGGSNGGLLVGAVMTQRPELFKVAFPAVGVLDMLRYHKFTSGAGWASDYGTSEESEEMFQYLYNYSPYHALKQNTQYPATLITTADHDDRVVPAHSFKFGARLQEYHSGVSPVLLRVQTNAGHGSVSTEQIISLMADTYSFAWYNMGVEPMNLIE